MKQIFLLIFIATIIFLFFYFDLLTILSFENLKKQQLILQNYDQEFPLKTSLAFFFLYIIITSSSLPGATILTLASGLIFGFVWGVVLSSFASTIGASFAFLIVRYVIGNKIQNKYEKQFYKINEGIKKEGNLYLFSLRLIPLFPFFLVNLLMGLTKLRLINFIIISQIAMLPATAIFVFAGVEIGKIENLSDILSLKLILAFSLIGLFPLLVKKVFFRNYKK